MNRAIFARCFFAALLLCSGTVVCEVSNEWLSGFYFGFGGNCERISYNNKFATTTAQLLKSKANSIDVLVNFMLKKWDRLQDNDDYYVVQKENLDKVKRTRGAFGGNLSFGYLMVYDGLYMNAEFCFSASTANSQSFSIKAGEHVMSYKHKNGVIVSSCLFRLGCIMNELDSACYVNFGGSRFSGSVEGTGEYTGKSNFVNFVPLVGVGFEKRIIDSKTSVRLDANYNFRCKKTAKISFNNADEIKVDATLCASCSRSVISIMVCRYI